MALPNILQVRQLDQMLDDTEGCKVSGAVRIPTAAIHSVVEYFQGLWHTITDRWGGIPLAEV
jgi:hypothetical protein